MDSFVIGGEYFSFSSNRNTKEDEKKVRKIMDYLNRNKDVCGPLEIGWHYGSCEFAGECCRDSLDEGELIFIKFFFATIHLYDEDEGKNILNPDWLRIMGEDENCVDEFVAGFRCESCKTWFIDFDY